MEDKLNPKIVSLTLVSVSVILSLICALLIALAPEPSLKIFGSIFHGMDIAKITTPVTISGVLTGLIAITITAYTTGWLFAVIYNHLSKKIG